MEQRVCQVPNDLVIPFSISMKISQKINKSFFLQSPHSLLLKSLSFGLRVRHSLNITQVLAGSYIFIALV